VQKVEQCSGRGLDFPSKSEFEEQMDHW